MLMSELDAEMEYGEMRVCCGGHRSAVWGRGDCVGVCFEGE